ncbi:MAG: helix-turn-helix transcriptional regulator [Lachnospiraceae bacterium]|nr:helix-turn-helix transcriptional regulator [Lachnospiraceae bacterium]
MDVTNDGMKKFRDRLLALRGHKTQKEVAADIGMTAASIGYYENGNRKPDITVLLKLAKYYNVSCDYLLGISDTKSPDTNTQGFMGKTGLSEKAIEKIYDLNTKNYATGNIDTLSLLIEDCNFPYLLSLISGYVVANDSKESSVDIGNARTSIKETDLTKAAIQNTIIDIADRIRNAYSARYKTVDERLDDILTEKIIDRAKEQYSQGKMSKREFDEACREYSEGNFEYDMKIHS